jgi:putative two-component system response regulator
VAESAATLSTFLSPPDDLTGAEAVAVLEQLAQEISSQLAAPTPQSSAFFTAALGALRRIKLPEGLERQVECLLDVARFFYITGQPLNGIEPVCEAIDQAQALGNKPLLRLAAMLHGVLLADTGNWAMAIERYVMALNLALELSDESAEAAVWNNLGIAFLNAGQYAEAISCFERAISLAERNGALIPIRILGLTNIAQAYLHLEEYSKGLRAIKKAIVECGEPQNAIDMLARVIAERNYTRLLLEVDNLTLAKERSDLAKHYAALSKSPRAEVNAAIAEGLCEVRMGLVDIGISRLIKTLDRARTLKTPLRDALMAIAKAYEIVGEPEQALVYVRELMSHIRKAQQENALYYNRLHLEQLARSRGEAGTDEPGRLLEDRPAGCSPVPLLQRREAELRAQLAERELMRSRVELLERLAVTAELRDDSSGEHAYRVGRLSALLAAEVGCDDDACFMIELAARLHDIGKIGIPDAILLKTDRLTHAERDIVRTHVDVGAELLAQSTIPHMKMAEEIARHHHEWWDGTGYPSGQAGEEIPLAARIVGVAEVFDALTHRRPYKEAWPVAQALEEIGDLAGSQFDPSLAASLVVLIRRLQREQGDLDVYLGQAAKASPFIQARRKIVQALRRPHGERDALRH